MARWLGLNMEGWEGVWRWTVGPKQFWLDLRRMERWRCTRGDPPGNLWDFWWKNHWISGFSTTIFNLEKGHEFHFHLKHVFSWVWIIFGFIFRVSGRFRRIMCGTECIKNDHTHNVGFRSMFSIRHLIMINISVVMSIPFVNCDQYFNDVNLFENGHPSSNGNIPVSVKSKCHIAGCPYVWCVFPTIPSNIRRYPYTSRPTFLNYPHSLKVNHKFFSSINVQFSIC